MRPALPCLCSWLLLAACGAADGDGPEAARARVAVAVRARDPGLLFDALDAESRGAVDTIWRYQRESAELVARDFPPDARARELRRVARATAAGSAREYFAAWVAPRDPWRAPPPAESGPVAVRDPRGRWGWAGYRDDLQRERDAAANDLARLKENAAIYRKSW
jgi:hypothetical protein